ncbi:type IV pilus assembly protein PilM [Nocardioides pacificus]
MARTMVGLDIGSSEVRAAEYVLGRRATLRRTASLPLPPGVVRVGTVVDPEALTAALRELWSRGKFRTREVVIGIANDGVLVRQMDLDWMPPADFRKALRYQVKDLLPTPVDDANLDYHLLEEIELPGEVEGDPPRRINRVLLVAAARDMVDRFVRVAQSAGLRPTAVDLVPFALIRARTPGVAPGEYGEVEAIVDIGAQVVTVVVHAGGVPRYVRIIPGMGGDSITQRVQEHYDWTWDEAERTKIFVALPGHARLDSEQLHALGPQAAGLDHPAQRLVAAGAETLVGEIAATLDYYRGPGHETVPGEPGGADATPTDELARVFLAGGGAQLGGLADLLRERLGVAVGFLDGLDRVRAPHRLRGDDDTLRALTVPTGLCVGGAR